MHRILKVIALVILVLIGLLLIDNIPFFLNDIKPPKDMSTIEEFWEWKAEGISGEGIYKKNGKIYSVLTGGYSTLLASKPAAYIF